MILIDSNVPMYLIGADHRHKFDAERLVEAALADGTRLVSDAGVLQEICHRYAAIGRLEAIQPAFDLVWGITDEIIAIEPADVDAAKDMLVTRSVRGARDAIHLAVMRRHGIRRIMTFDRGFDEHEGIDRLH